VTVGPVVRNDASEPFFDGTAALQFLIRRCAPAGHFSRPQAKRCDVCGSPDLSYQPASGKARLVSWVVVPVRGATPGGPAQVVPIIAELDEGPWWWSMIVGADPAELREGLPLRVRFERPEGSEAVPVFELDRDRPAP
jgi:uncharacterized OB-fold protein